MVNLYPILYWKKETAHKLTKDSLMFEELEMLSKSGRFKDLAGSCPYLLKKVFLGLLCIKSGTLRIPGQCWELAVTTLCLRRSLVPVVHLLAHTDTRSFWNIFVHRPSQIGWSISNGWGLPQDESHRSSGSSLVYIFQDGPTRRIWTEKKVKISSPFSSFSSSIVLRERISEYDFVPVRLIGSGPSCQHMLRSRRSW